MTESLFADFERIFGQSAEGGRRAPGRVNLIGEHTDYNDGFVLPIAIEKQTVALFAPRDDALVRLASRQSDPPGEIVTLDLERRIAPAEPAWANYPRGVIAFLDEMDDVELRGADLLFDSDVPLGGGLSSSASLEVAAAEAILAASGQSHQVPERHVALICQRAEHEFADAPCGIMDQSIAVMGREGFALLLDCRDGSTRHVPFNDPETVLLVADTEVKHAIGGGEYAERREQCHSAAGKLGVEALRDASMDDLERQRGTLYDVEYHRARHVIGEIARTLEAVEALEAADLGRFGERMSASHASLRDDYEVSCPELDAIVNAAERIDGVYGARMTGGGFGGCAIVLCRKDATEAATAGIRDAFEAQFARRCPVFATRAAEGAGAL